MGRLSRYLAEPMLSEAEAVPRTATWKVVVFVVSFLSIAALSTFTYMPSRDPPTTALWATPVKQAMRHTRVTPAMPQTPGFLRSPSRTGLFPTAQLSPFARPAPLRGDLLQVLAGKLLSTNQIPPQIPRDDFMDQMAQWAAIEAGEQGKSKFGLPMKVERTYKEVGDATVLWGFIVTLMRDRATVCDLHFTFDDEILIKYQFLTKDKDGMPQPGGRKEEILGKNLEIWKTDDNPVTPNDKEVIKALLTAASLAINAYYAFGSVWSEDI
eukprot:gnl/MRDRNA2_/MRDRNA2_107393_c0_seq1.p1 gnl/MRDRNA2_/MRDRNA2_107393_c0~~gnl/MRDRNA2_/MRDRNA2_107393_c0_seq1.p1  ORF type:complete len:268 (+),score=39.43 gnl/MRDRNA2_/MRDRNA2_107393_c0_seq1:72-875(+)